MVKRQEGPPARDRRERSPRECRAQPPPERDTEHRVSVSPQHPHRPLEPAEPGGGIEQYPGVNLPGERGDVATDPRRRHRGDPLAGQRRVEGPRQRSVGQRTVPHRLRADGRQEARRQPGMTQQAEQRRERQGREGPESVAVGEDRAADPARVSAQDELADRPAGVVADEDHVAEAEGVDEGQDKDGDPGRGEVGAGLQRRLVRTQREGRRVAAHSLLRQARGDRIPEPGVDEEPVHEHHGRPGAAGGGSRDPVGEAGLRKIYHRGADGGVMIGCHARNIQSVCMFVDSPPAPAAAPGTGTIERCPYQHP